MRFPILALLGIPAIAAASMVLVAIPAGDAIDDSVVVLLGVPALASAWLTFALAHQRRVRRCAAWAVASGLATVPVFGVIFAGAWAIA